MTRSPCESVPDLTAVSDSLEFARRVEHSTHSDLADYLDYPSAEGQIRAARRTVDELDEYRTEFGDLLPPELYDLWGQRHFNRRARR